MAEENTYFLDPESSAEMTRLTTQDGVLTKETGGLFAERQNDFSGIHDVLDIGCGPGGWVNELAYLYPEIQVTGIDISKRMLAFAESQKQLQGSENARFVLMDATKPLAFPDHSFDFINARFQYGFLDASLWSKAVQEYHRILRPDGYLRLTETEYLGSSNSIAMEILAELLRVGLKRTGHSLALLGSRGNGVVPDLAPLLRQQGFEQVRIYSYTVDYSFATPAHASMTKDWDIGYREAFPFFLAIGAATLEKFKRIYAGIEESIPANISDDERTKYHEQLTPFEFIRNPAMPDAEKLEELHRMMLQDFQKESFRANFDVTAVVGHKADT